MAFGHFGSALVALASLVAPLAAATAARAAKELPADAQLREENLRLREENARLRQVSSITSAPEPQPLGAREPLGSPRQTSQPQPLALARRGSLLAHRARGWRGDYDEEEREEEENFQPTTTLNPWQQMSAFTTMPMFASPFASTQFYINVVLPTTTPGPTTQAPLTTTSLLLTSTTPMPTTTLAPSRESEDASRPPSVDERQVNSLKDQITELRKEVVHGSDDMWNAAKLISSTVDKDEKEMKAMTMDITTLRGRQGGGAPVVVTECTGRQSSCGECLALPSCVWCKVEQRCYSGDASGPGRGECAFFRHGQCE